jgi:tRNA threonylcarbamoyladenosine biosynthesis protein TsaE
VKSIVLRSADETAALGATIAALLGKRVGLVIYLEGVLGAGKTTLARGLLRAMGVMGTIRSPTYTLLEPYEVGGRTLVHVDLYRLQDARELEPLGLRDYPAERCWWLIEWPERGAGRLPAADLSVHLSHDGAARRALVGGPAAQGLSPA